MASRRIGVLGWCMCISHVTFYISSSRINTEISFFESLVFTAVCCIFFSFFLFFPSALLRYFRTFFFLLFSGSEQQNATLCRVTTIHSHISLVSVSPIPSHTHTWTEGVGALSSWPSDVVIVLYAWCRRQTQPDAAPRHTHIEINRATAFNAIYSTEEKHDNYPKNSFQCTSSAQYMHTHMLSHCSSVAMSVQQQQQ